jgi:hypothetical protein
MISDSIRAANSTGLVVALPAHSLNSTGRHTGAVQNGNQTTIPAITHRFPRAIFLPPWEAPSWVQNACQT